MTITAEERLLGALIGAQSEIAMICNLLLRGPIAQEDLPKKLRSHLRSYPPAIANFAPARCWLHGAVHVPGLRPRVVAFAACISRKVLDLVECASFLSAGPVGQGRQARRLRLPVFEGSGEGPSRHPMLTNARHQSSKCFATGGGNSAHSRAKPGYVSAPRRR